MQNKLTGVVDLVFIRGGISSKSGNPYLQVSNGRKELFVTLDDELKITENTFSGYNEEDPISLEVEQVVGSDTVRVLDIVPEQ